MKFSEDLDQAKYIGILLEGNILMCSQHNGRNGQWMDVSYSARRGYRAIEDFSLGINLTTLDAPFIFIDLNTGRKQHPISTEHALRILCQQPLSIDQVYFFDVWNNERPNSRILTLSEPNVFLISNVHHFTVTEKNYLLCKHTDPMLDDRATFHLRSDENFCSCPNGIVREMTMEERRAMINDYPKYLRVLDVATEVEFFGERFMT